MSKRATLASGAVGLVLILAILAAATVALGQTAEPAASGPARTITVSSGATISTAPDEAVVSFTVRAEDADSVVALDESSRIMNAVLAAMKKLGITERDMETTSIKLSQQTLDRGTSFERTVFVSSSALEVTIGNFERIGPAIRDGVEAGATSVRGVRFQVSDPAQAKRRALDAAVRSARTKADALAQAAGAEVTGVIQISEEGTEEPRPYFAMSDTLAYASARDLSVVPPKDIETEVTITSIWGIG
jgi:uncharacterized protein YggE